MGTLGSMASGRCSYRAYLDCCWDNKFFSESLTKRSRPGKRDIQRTDTSPDCIGCVIYWSDSSCRGIIREEISCGVVLLVSTHLWHPNRNELLGRNPYRRLVDANLRKAVLEQMQKYTDDGKIVMIVTASPRFAVSYCAEEYPFAVVGTDFVVNDGVHGSETEGPICYGSGKVEKIFSWVNSNIEGSYEYFESWSDEISDLPMLNLSKQQVIVCNKNDEKQFKGYFDSPTFLNPI